MQLTTWEAAKKFGISTSHLRRLLAAGTVKGRQAQLTAQRFVWLIDVGSLRSYIAQKRKPGRPRSTKRNS